MNIKIVSLALVSTTLALAAASASAQLNTPEPEVTPEAELLFEQPLTSFEDSCEQQSGTQIRHVRFASLDGSNHVEDQLELRTTTRTSSSGSTRVLDYLVNDVPVFVKVTGEDAQMTPAGAELLRDEDRAPKLLAAFAAAHPRVFAADIETPQQSCGASAGKPEEQAKCGAIGVLGCFSGNPVVCGVSAGLAVLCNYLVEKACEDTPESCEPGWTEG